MTYFIEYADGVRTQVFRLRGHGQHKWGWEDRKGSFVYATHLEVARYEAEEVGGKFITIRQPKATKPAGYPTGLANLLKGKPVSR